MPNPWTKEQAKAMAPKGGKAKAEKQRARNAARKARLIAMRKALADEPADLSPEAMLERRIARLTQAGARPIAIDRLSITLARLRKSQSSKRRQAVQPFSHNIDYTSIGSVATQPLTQIKPSQPEATTTPSVTGSKESLSPAGPQALEGVGAAAGPPGESVNTLSTPTPHIPEAAILSDVTPQPLTDSGDAPWAELVASPKAQSVGIKVEEQKSEAHPVACPGAGYVKVKVGKYWVWSKPNADYRPNVGFKR